MGPTLRCSSPRAVVLTLSAVLVTFALYSNRLRWNPPVIVAGPAHRAGATPVSSETPTLGSEASSATPSSSIAPQTSSSYGVGDSAASFSLTSASGRFAFSLLPSGSLSLTDRETGIELFTSDTEYWWPVRWHVELTHDAVLKLSWSNITELPYRGTPWLSTLLPDCDAVPYDSSRPPLLELLDSGLLHVRTGARSSCVLSRAVDDKGRLAIVHTGFLRTYLQTCEEQNQKLVESWTGSGGVHVHVFAYLEDVYHEGDEPVTRASIEGHLRVCFGSALKTVEVLRLDQVRETVENASDKLLEHCDRDKLSHHASQWKALYLAGKQVQHYMVEHGISYDYVFKGRPDLQYWGSVPPLSSITVPPNGIVAPQIALDWTWYTMLHDGELRAGVTDMAALGRPNAMFTYLSLYREFVRLRTMEKTVAKWEAFNTKAWTKVSDGEGCTPESILAYWLRLNGISVKVDWRFQMGLLRGDGSLKNTCPSGRNWLCPGFVPKTNEEGHFI